MRFWTVLLSLVVVAAVAVNASAQDTKKKKGDRPRISFKDMDANSDGKLIKDEYVAAHTKNAPADKQEKAKERAGRMWDRLAGDKKELSEDEYKAAMEKMMKEWTDKRGKKRGEKKE
jgi:hypothetical protein